MSNNVIEFPRDKMGSPNRLPTAENVKENIDAVKMMHIQETISLIAPLLFQQLSMAGFEIDDEDNEDSYKDSAFLIESLRSILFRYYELDHPFQKISENVFKSEENGLLSVVDTLQLNLKKEEVVEHKS